MKEEHDIFKWEGWDQLSEECFVFYDVVFLKDFGIFKKDEKYKDVYMSYQEGYIESADDKKLQKFELVPIE